MLGGAGRHGALAKSFAAAKILPRLPPPPKGGHGRKSNEGRGQRPACRGHGVLSTGGPGYRRGRYLDATPGGRVCLAGAELPIPRGFPLV
jgi:hypothetical protein